MLSRRLLRLAGRPPSLCAVCSRAPCFGQQPAQRKHAVAATPPAQGQDAPLAQLPRFYAQDLPATAGASVDLDPEEARHAARVLRLKPGDQVELCDGSGRLVRCEITAADRGSATVAALTAPRELAWAGPRWTLAVACLTLKGGRTDWLVEKATELGAHALVPLVTERSQAGGRARFKTSGGPGRGAAAAADAAPAAAAGGDAFQPGRLERLAVAATKQSLRLHAMRLAPPTPLQPDLLAAVAEAPLALLATAGAPPLGRALSAALCGSLPPAGHLEAWSRQPCYLLVGPEGDFTPGEVRDLVAAGAVPVGLGPHRLRTETAALALLAAAAAYADAAAAAAAAADGSHQQG